MENLVRLSRSFLKNNNQGFRRYVFDSKNLFSSRFSFLIGQRGVGKTTAIIQYMLSRYNEEILSEKMLYVPVDHFLVKSPIYYIAEEFCNLGGELLCLDEIHKYPDWSIELKSIYDTFPKLKIIVSGSSALEIHKGSHDLSRRGVIFRMAGLSFREFCSMRLNIKLERHDLNDIVKNHEELSGKIISKLERNNQKVLLLFKDYLKFGYYPYFAEFEDASIFHLILEQKIHDVIESDLLAVHPSLNGNSIRKIKKLLELLSANVPFTPDMKKLKLSLEIGDERTLKNYLKFLSDAGVILILNKGKYSMNTLQKPEKIYLNNTNMIYALNQLDNIDKGNLRETFFANMLSVSHGICASDTGDFIVDNTLTFEVGGKSKTGKQIKDVRNSYLVLDDIETGYKSKIPLWLFGFLY